MNQDYIKPDNWSIIEEGFDAERVKSSESLFSIGNGAMGQEPTLKKPIPAKHSKVVILPGSITRDQSRLVEKWLS
jgi:maltose phosphorylase